MTIRYICPYWGMEGTPADIFIKKAIESGYGGVEINLPGHGAFVESFMDALANARTQDPGFVFIAQQVLGSAAETASAYEARMRSRLEYLAYLAPDFINSHTGKDYFSFADNCRLIESCAEIADRTGIQIVHEIHRGRFTFHASSLVPYLDIYPHLLLTADFSHWCTVSESMLADQTDILSRVISHVKHIHARVGFEHGPQVNDAFAPEWSAHVDIFTDWWQQIADSRQHGGSKILTVTPETGPAPYMPTVPYTAEPLSDQWLTNIKIKQMLQTKLT